MIIGLKIVTTVSDVFLLLISIISIVGNRLHKGERNAMLFCLLLAIANIMVIWGTS